MYYVYVLLSEASDVYVGFTEDLKKRFHQHNSGKNVSTKGKKWNLVYYEAYASKLDAVKREKKLKYRGQAKRLLKMRLKNSFELACSGC